jgi:hypothetical protein
MRGDSTVENRLRNDRPNLDESASNRLKASLIAGIRDA